MMSGRALPAACALGAMLACAPAANADEQRPPPKSPPALLRPLTPAVSDDMLEIGGEDINGRKFHTRMTVPVQVNGRGPYRFIVDSGADTSVIGTRIARALALPAGDRGTCTG